MQSFKGVVMNNQNTSKPYLIAGVAFLVYGAYRYIQENVELDDKFQDIKKCCDSMSGSDVEFENDDE